jgi:hypothetical protein
MNIRKLLERLYPLPYKLQQIIGLLVLIILCGTIYGAISLAKLSIMNDPNYVLATIMIIIGFTSLVIASRKSGYIVGYGVSFRDRYTIDKAALGDYCRILLLAIAGLFIIGLLFSQDILTIFDFTAINTFFIGYALAWKKVIRLK